MASIQAFEGSLGNLHRRESSALAEIICESQGTLGALLETDDPDYQPRLRQAIVRAAEMLERSRRKRKR